MDRSFLSRPEVIAASRNFVCIRLLSYENKQEAEYLKRICRTGSGELENTVAAVLTPDARQMLTYGRRGTRELFGDAAGMAAFMNQTAKKYTATATPADLPEVATVRLALDVAASDNQPLVVAYGADEAAVKTLRQQLEKAAWGQSFIGRFVYASTNAAKDLAPTGGGNPGVLVIQPDKFGQKGTLLASAPAGASQAEIEAALKKGIAAFKPDDKSFGNHVRAGHQQGQFWETLLPVTDPMEAAARERGRQMRRNP